MRILCTRDAQERVYGAQLLFPVTSVSVPIRGSISTGSWYCWSCTAEL